jgi:cell division GTPase FtsZ
MAARVDPALDRMTEVVRMLVTLMERGNWPAVDFIDEREVLRDGGPGLLGMGEGEGPTRAVDAARGAVRDLDQQVVRRE